MTTRGFQEKEFVQIAHYIDEAIRNQDDARALDAIREKVVSLNRAFPLPYRKVG